MIDPILLYEQGLSDGCGQLESGDGTSWTLPIRAWQAEPDVGDLRLLDRCHGPTLDVGCGPGRLTAALSRRGLPALGVDISPMAVAITVARGGTAMRRDVFELTAGEHRWQHVILADGNVGIGGDPVRMLWRCRELICPAGSVLLDLEPPGTGLRSGRVRLVSGAVRSAWFGWAWLGTDALAGIAATVGLRPRAVWRVPGPVERWQAELVMAPDWPLAADRQEFVSSENLRAAPDW